MRINIIVTFVKKKSYKSELNRHKKSCQELLACCYCDKGFKGEKNLKEHTKGKHSSHEDWRYECKLC